MKRLILLGASGSIGTQTIDVIKEHSDELELVGVSVGRNVDYLVKLLNEFQIKYAYTIEENKDLAAMFPGTRFFYCCEGLQAMAKLPDYDMLVNALVGFVGFKPTLSAIKNHKDIALANKETLVAGGRIINELLEEYKVNLYPIDSEHVAIWQCMQGHEKEDIHRLIITASGGAFRDLNREQLAEVKLSQALNHPVWNMGAKITIDSSTMMNKGFEVIEASHLFGVPADRIDVLVHRESMIHSMVEYIDNSIIAQMSVPDMRLCVQYALTAPRRKKAVVAPLDLAAAGKLTFARPDEETFVLLPLARKALARGGACCAALNAANEVAVAAFLAEKIPLLKIFDVVSRVVSDMPHAAAAVTLPQILEADQEARERAAALL